MLIKRHIIILTLILGLSGCGMAIESLRVDSGSYKSNTLDVNIERIEQYSSGFNLFLFLIPVGFYNDSDIEIKPYPYNINLKLTSKKNNNTIDFTKSELYVKNKPHKLIGSEFLYTTKKSIWVSDCSYIYQKHPRIANHEKYLFKDHINNWRNYYDSENVFKACKTMYPQVARYKICPDKKNIDNWQNHYDVLKACYQGKQISPLGTPPIIELMANESINIKLLYDYNGISKLDNEDVYLKLVTSNTETKIILKSIYETHTKHYGAQGYSP